MHICKNKAGCSTTGKKYVFEGLICLLTGVIAIIIFCVYTNIWNMDLNVPITYSGDVTGLLIIIKSVLREEKWWSFDALGAPFYTNRWRLMLDGGIPNALMFIFAKITKSVGYGINVYYIISYGLYGICTYYMIRKAGMKKRYSVIGAILYALIPGHYQRGEAHIYVGSCFSIPLVIVAAMNLFSGKMCRSSLALKEKLTPKELVVSNSKEQNLGLLFLSIVTFCTIYYGIFSLMLLTFCAIYCSISKKQLRHIYYYFQYVCIEIICLGIIFFPQIVANKFDPCVEIVQVITRYRGNVETYAGKLIQYILPIEGHRIPILAKLRSVYDSAYPLVNENTTSSLGIVMTFGFLISLLACFFSGEKILEKYEAHGKIELFLFFVSTIGGLGAIVGLINYNLRCYNRFSYFIGAVGIIVSMNLIQEFCLRLENKKYINTVVSYLLCVLVLGIGILDQLPDGMHYTKEQGEKLSIEYYNDAKFVRGIEEYEGQNANILVLPVMNAKQSAIATTKDGCRTGYKDQLLFIHSSTSNWSVGGSAGEEGERWLNWLQRLDEGMQVKVAAAVGISGIAVYYGGYGAEQLNMQLSKLEEIAGSPAVVNDNGTWAYYSLENVRDAMLERYSVEKMEEFKKRFLYEYCVNVAEYNSDNLNTTSELQNSKEITLTEGTSQGGPYSKFGAGLYAVKVYGNNLEKVKVDCIANGISFGIAIEEHTSGYIKYYVAFDADVEDVEFRTINVGDEKVIVKRIEVNKIANDFINDI